MARAKEGVIASLFEGNWMGALGIAAVGGISAIGVVPAIIIILGLLGVGIFLFLNFLPLIVSLVAGGVVFYLGGMVNLNGVQRIASAIGATLLFLVVFNFVDVTLLSAAGASTTALSGQSAGAQGLLDFITSPMEILSSLLVALVGIVTIFMVSQTGGKIGAIFAGAVGIGVMGFVVYQTTDLLAMGAGTTSTTAHAVVSIVAVFISIWLGFVYYVYERR